MNISTWQAVRRLHRVCVVIPAHNEELLIGRCIQSVLDTGVPAESIVVVDDCSTDQTFDVASRFAGVTILRNVTKLGKLGGLHRAIADCSLKTRFDYLALLDADSHVHPDYFTAVLRSFLEDPQTVLV